MECNGIYGPDIEICTSEFVPHVVGGAVLVHLGGEVVPGGEVLEPEQRVPVAGAAAARLVLHHLHLPQRLR